MPKRAVIIGGGVGGLSAAVRLAARGIDVTLLEKNERVGGKLNLWEVPHPGRPGERPFRFDTGPSLLTLPLVFADLFHAAGRDVRDYLQIEKLDPIARFVWPDGTTFELHPDEDDQAAAVSQLSPGDVAGWRALHARGGKIWDLAGEMFLSQSPEQAMRRKEGEPPWKGLAMLTTPLRIGMFSRFSRVIDRHVKSQKLREVLYQYATYSGASPFRAPATLAVIPYVERHFGGWYVKGGMYRIAEALAKLAGELGVDLRTNAPVARIDVSAVARASRPRASLPTATGVTLRDGSTVKADAVIANADVVSTYRNLIDPAHRRRFPDAKLDKLEPGGSGMVLLLGVEGTYPQLAHHTKFMPADYTSDLTAMFETHTVPADPCIYVAAATRTDPTQAPEGCENLFVLASAPALDGSLDWENEGPRYRDQLVKKLENSWGLSDLSRRIVAERRMTPKHLALLYDANLGSIYGLGSNSRRAAFLRPPNRDRDVAGLFFAGGATHPGGGLPLVALSGKIASELVADYLA